MCDSVYFFFFLTGLSFKDSEDQKLIVPVPLGFFFPKHQRILKRLVTAVFLSEITAC